MCVEDLPDLERHLNAALAAEIPPRVGRRAQEVALDFHDRPYYCKMRRLYSAVKCRRAALTTTSGSGPVAAVLPLLLLVSDREVRHDSISFSALYSNLSPNVVSLIVTQRVKPNFEVGLVNQPIDDLCDRSFVL